VTEVVGMGGRERKTGVMGEVTGVWRWGVDVDGVRGLVGSELSVREGRLDVECASGRVECD